MSEYIFGDTVVVKLVAVRFAELECDAIEMMDGTGICIATRGHEMYSPLVRIGMLKCGTCLNEWRFPEDGRIFAFPFAPMPGWIVWNPGVLLREVREPQKIAPMVRCDRCSRRLDAYLTNIFRYRVKRR